MMARKSGEKRQRVIFRCKEPECIYTTKEGKRFYILHMKEEHGIEL